MGSSGALGRTRGRDRENGKATYPSILGLPRSGRALIESVAACREAIPSGRNARLFGSLIDAVVVRLPESWSEPLWASANGNGGRATVLSDPAKSPRKRARSRR